MANTYFEVYYPDPVEGSYQTKTFYVGDRPCPAAFEKGGKLFWQGIEVTLIER
jgi:hypothetical protein